jgi:hypothetical protein
MNTTYENRSLSSILFGKTRQALLSIYYGHPDESYYLSKINEEHYFINKIMSDKQVLVI